MRNLFFPRSSAMIDKEVIRMLVLSRKEAERIRLGDSIVLTIIQVSGDKVRLGIEAPSDMLVLRDELERYTKQQVAGPVG